MEGGIPQGTQVGSYVIDSFLGRGGMGIVYRAYHPRLARWAAIKLLPPFHSATDQARERFEREARAIARLRHRHILTVFDFGEFAGQPYMVVEYMPNGSLSEKMPKDAVTPAQAIALLRPLGAALDYAHQQGVLHRDVKPANVFLDGELQPVLADFGLAKMFTEESLTASGMISGTPTHISPEQTMGKVLTPASDLYSLTVIAYQLLAGRLPFQGQSLMDLLYAHVNNEPPPPSSLNPALPASIDDVILRGLAKDPAGRWPTAAELVGAIEAAAAGRVDERRPRIPEVATVVMAPPAPPSAPASPPSDADATPAKRPARRRGPLLAATAAVIVVAIVAGILLLAGAGRPGSTVVLGPGVGGTPGGPTPTPTAARTLSVTPPPPLVIGSPISVTGKGLDPKLAASTGVLQSGAVHPISAGMQVQADGSFSVDGVVPRDLSTGDGVLVACNFDAQGKSDLSKCVQLKVTITR